MIFNIVIGNPPYNRDIYLDFVNLGFSLCDKCCIMVTPAKWQTASDTHRVIGKINYNYFRKTLVQHMSKVVFYPDCKDIFDIYQCDGISYYLLDKNNTYKECEVRNISKNRPEIESPKTVYRSILNRETLWNCAIDILNHIKGYNKLRIGDTGARYKVMTNKQLSGYDWFIKSGPRYCLGISVITDSLKGEEVTGVKDISFSSDSKADCESFISYLNSKFVRFLLAINLSNESGMVTNDNFRFVPAPISDTENLFNKIYTDIDIYKMFNLSDEHIKIIESIIKER